MYPYLEAPVFSVNNLYDTSGIANILGITCIEPLVAPLRTALTVTATSSKTIRKHYGVLTQVASINGNGVWGLLALDIASCTPMQYTVLISERLRQYN